MSMLKVENLSVHYGMIQAVRDVSFEVNEGEVVSLIGANGAGKTTILRTLSGLVRPSSGKIEFLGQKIKKTEKEFREKALYYLQDVIKKNKGRYSEKELFRLVDLYKSLGNEKAIDEVFSKAPSEYWNLIVSYYLDEELVCKDY